MVAVGRPASDPRLEWFAGGAKVRENDNWSDDPRIAVVSNQVGAFTLTSTTPRDAALFLPAVAPGSYTMHVMGPAGGKTATGIALAEIYDATPAGSATAATPRLTNVSARTHVGVGGDILIAGFVIAGEVPKNVLIRAIGPTLRGFGIDDALPDPKLELFASAGKMAGNDNWGGASSLATTAKAVGAFPLEPETRDAVLLITLQPGVYTVQISDVNQSSGVAMVEIYEAP